jgi:hypothetical protein
LQSIDGKGKGARAGAFDCFRLPGPVRVGLEASGDSQWFEAEVGADVVMQSGIAGLEGVEEIRGLETQVPQLRYASLGPIIPTEFSRVGFRRAVGRYEDFDFARDDASITLWLHRRAMHKQKRPAPFLA